MRAGPNVGVYVTLITVPGALISVVDSVYMGARYAAGARVVSSDVGSVCMGVRHAAGALGALACEVIFIRGSAIRERSAIRRLTGNRRAIPDRRSNEANGGAPPVEANNEREAADAKLGGAHGTEASVPLGRAAPGGPGQEDGADEGPIRHGVSVGLQTTAELSEAPPGLPMQGAALPCRETRCIELVG